MKKLAILFVLTAFMLAITAPTYATVPSKPQQEQKAEKKDEKKCDKPCAKACEKTCCKKDTCKKSDVKPTK